MYLEKYERIIVFDLETTGLNYKTDKIIEFGALVLDYNANEKKFEEKLEIDDFVNIGFKIPPKIVELTNITDEMLLVGISEAQLAHKIQNLITDNTLILAYNIQFDISFLITLFNNYNLEINFNYLLDILAIYKDRRNYPHKLFNAIETYNVKGVNSHRAIDDVKATFLVFKEMLKELNNGFNYVNYIGYNAKYGLSGEKLSHLKYFPLSYGEKLIEKIK